jgi:spermidine synthase
VTSTVENSAQTRRPSEGGSASRAPDSGLTRVWFIFFASGAAGLGYEVVWTRWLSLGLGHEMPSMLAVVAAFFGGISIGAWTLDAKIRQSDKPSHWYAACEACIGLWGVSSIVWAPYLNRWTPLWIGVDPSPMRHWLVAFLAPLLALLPATMAMGASFPAYERLVARAHGSAKMVASLYAANTFGAIVGVFLTTTWLIELVGYAWTLSILAVLNLACAGGVLLLRPLEDKTREPPAAPFSDAPSPRALDRSIWLSGFLGIGYQVLCVAVLARATENTVYSFAGALAVFLLGTAMGAAIYHHYGERFTFGSGLRLALPTLGLTTAGSIAVLSQGRELHDYLQSLHSGDIAGVLRSELALAGLVMLVPAAAMGFLFSHLLQTARASASGLGRSLGINTLGSAMAPFAFGVVLLPSMGAKWALLIIAAAYFAWMFVIVSPGRREYVLLGAAFVLLFVLPDDLLLIASEERSQIVAAREGLMGTVSVYQTSAEGDRQLRVNNRFIMGGTGRGFLERRMGLMPLLLHGHPKRALFLGVGAGATLGQAARYPLLEVSAAELLQDVVDVLPEFRSIDPVSNVPIHVADARRFVRATDRLYDVVVADLFHPARDGAGLLYTLDHYETIRTKLSAGGVFVQWLPLYQMSVETFRTIVRSFVEAFPHASAYLGHFNVDSPVIGLLGSIEPRSYDMDWYRATLPKDRSVHSALEQLALTQEIDLFGSLLADDDTLRKFSADAARNTDDRPSLVFTAPRFLYDRTAKRYGVLRQLLESWTPTAALVTRALELEDAASAERIARFARARDLYLLSHISRFEPKSPGEPLDLLLKSAGESPDFRTAYVYAVQVAIDVHPHDPVTSRGILERLQEVVPGDPRASEVLRKLFP